MAGELVTTPSFDDLRGDLPDHNTEVMASHPGQPTVAQQDRTHGVGLPPPDLGNDDSQKYS